MPLSGEPFLRPRALAGRGEAGRPGPPPGLRPAGRGRGGFPTRDACVGPTPLSVPPLRFLDRPPASPPPFPPPLRAEPATAAEAEANERRHQESGGGVGPQDAWRWTLNWDVISPYDIMIGSCPRSAGDVARIAKEAGATAILSLQCDDCLDALKVDVHEVSKAAARHRVLWARVPTRDFDSRDQANGLPHASRALGALMLLGHRVYVHCTAGINRAALTVLAYLTDIKGVPLDEAYKLVRERRSQANPYLESWKAARAHMLAGREDEVRDAARRIAETRKAAPVAPRQTQSGGDAAAHAGSLPGYPTAEHERLANAPAYDPTADWFLAEATVVRSESVRGSEAMVALVEGARAAHAAALAAAEERAEREHAAAREAEARAAEAEARAAEAEARAAAAVAAAEARAAAAESGSDARVAAAEAAARAAASRLVAQEASGHLVAPTAAIDGIRRARAQAAELAETLEELAAIEHGIQAAIEEEVEEEEEAEEEREAAAKGE